MLILKAQALSGTKKVAHGFFGRTGGVSSGIYAFLNCGPGSSDNPGFVRENRKRAVQALDPGAKLVTLYQVHSARAVAVTAPWETGSAPQADAMVTNVPGIALGILAADCAPILLADETAGIVGAAHSGWKGALGGVAESVVAAMEQLGARRADIVAAIGPCISQANYEVGPELRAAFLERSAENDRYFALGTRENRFQFDLEAYAAAQLAGAGLSRIERLSACTYAREANFFSFRRATHRGESDYGRQISAILLCK